jgi:4-hydroxybutyrate CoA-transferase
MKKRRRDLENWQEEFKLKRVSHEEAARAVKSGDNIFIPNGYLGKMPQAIAARQNELRDVNIEIQAPLSDPGWLSEGMEESFNVIIRIYLGNLGREAHDEGRVSFLPYTNGTWFKAYRDNRKIARDMDVLLLDVSPPDENGFMTFGSHIWERRHYVERAKTIIAEIDPKQIKAHGDTTIHVSEVDFLVELTSDDLTKEEEELLLSKIPVEIHEQARERFTVENPTRLRNLIDILDDFDPETIKMFFGADEPSQEVVNIADHLRAVVKDADTIQIGMGRPSRYIVDLGVFDNLNDIGIFSEMACPGMGFLVKRGIATGKYSTLHPGKAIFSALTGMRREEVLWAHDNPLIEQYSSDYVVNIANISQVKNMVAINNAIQVDLTGQITCETQFGSRLINGPGGQIEFHMGAFCAPGGRAITLLPSTWGEGSVSTIVPQLDQGTMVTIPRPFADTVITEWGIAELVGKTHRERAEELIRVAHPNFRDELTERAKELFRK